MYTIYCSNHPTAVDTKVKLAKKNSSFRKFLAVFLHIPCVQLLDI